MTEIMRLMVVDLTRRVVVGFQFGEAQEDESEVGARSISGT